MKKIINALVLSLSIVGSFSVSVAETSSQLTFEITEVGTGEVAKSGHRASLHYIGKLEDGSVFDSSRERGLSLRLHEADRQRCEIAVDEHS